MIEREREEESMSERERDRGRVKERVTAMYLIASELTKGYIISC